MDQVPCALKSRAAQNERLVRALWDVHHRMQRLYGGKASQSRILILLSYRGVMTQRALTEHLHIQPGSASEILAKMEHSGLIQRTPNASDRRTIDIRLTPEGQRQAAQALSRRQTLQREMFSCLSDQEAETLLELLGRLQEDWKARFSRE